MNEPADVADVVRPQRAPSLSAHLSFDEWPSCSGEGVKEHCRAGRFEPVFRTLYPVIDNRAGDPSAAPPRGRGVRSAGGWPAPGAQSFAGCGAVRTAARLTPAPSTPFSLKTRHFLEYLSRSCCVLSCVFGEFRRVTAHRHLGKACVRCVLS